MSKTRMVEIRKYKIEKNGQLSDAIEKGLYITDSTNEELARKMNLGLDEVIKIDNLYNCTGKVKIAKKEKPSHDSE